MWLNVYMTFSHYVNMSLCHLHIVCKLCVSSAHCVQIVCVLLVNVSVCQCHFCHVNMLYGHCMPCHYVQCHMVIVMLWSISCGLFSWESQNWSGVVVRSSSFLCNLIEVVFTFFGQCVVWVVFIFRLIMSTLVYEVMKVYLVRMSRCQNVPCEARSLCAVWGLTCCTVIITTFKGRVKN